MKTEKNWESKFDNELCDMNHTGLCLSEEQKILVKEFIVKEVVASAYERGREGELSKLIEECGDKFMELRSPMSNSKDYVDSRADGFLWTAIGEENVGDDGIRRSCIGNGSTPEEAVRNLLSTLNDMK